MPGFFFACEKIQIRLRSARLYRDLHMKKIVIAFVLMPCSSFANADCVSALVTETSNLQYAPVQEMLNSRAASADSSDCISTSNFIARFEAAIRAASRSTNSGSKPAAGRFNMTQNGKVMTADDFDAWMLSNGVSVVGGAAPKQPAPEPLCVPTKKMPCPEK